MQDAVNAAMASGDMAGVAAAVTEGVEVAGAVEGGMAVSSDRAFFVGCSESLPFAPCFGCCSCSC